MADDLIFMMGKYEARIPCDRLYSENHMSFRESSATAFQVGFTAYSVRLLQDVYFLEWTVDAGAAVRRKQEIGEIESSKALSTLYAPYDGRILKFNEELLNDPSAINTDTYGAGWLFEFETSVGLPERGAGNAEPGTETRAGEPRQGSESGQLLTAAEYVDFLEARWPETQRILKGQVT